MGHCKISLLAGFVSNYLNYTFYACPWEGVADSAETLADNTAQNRDNAGTVYTYIKAMLITNHAPAH